MGHVGTFMMAFNLALEFVGMKYRTMFGILIETPFALGGLIVGIVSYAGVRDWRTLTLGGSIYLSNLIIQQCSVSLLLSTVHKLACKVGGRNIFALFPLFFQLT